MCLNWPRISLEFSKMQKLAEEGEGKVDHGHSSDCRSMLCQCRHRADHPPQTSAEKQAATRLELGLALRLLLTVLTVGLKLKPFGLTSFRPVTAWLPC